MMKDKKAVQIEEESDDRVASHLENLELSRKMKKSKKDQFTFNYKKDEKLVLPTAPIAAHGPDVDLVKVPSNPPFTAFPGNLPYNVPEEDLVQFFRQLEVSKPLIEKRRARINRSLSQLVKMVAKRDKSQDVKNVRLPQENAKNGKIRGFGCAEFNNHQDLVQAWSLNNKSLKNSTIKISLAGEHDGKRGEDRQDAGADRTLGDWRSERQSSSCNTRNENISKVRSIKAPAHVKSKLYKLIDEQAPDEIIVGLGSIRERQGPNGENYTCFPCASNCTNYDIVDHLLSTKHKIRYLERLDADGKENSITTICQVELHDDYFWRHLIDNECRKMMDMYGSGTVKVYITKRSLGKERPRLQLAPRTKPIETVPPPAEAIAYSYIFGGAKPVDTAAREREIEARLYKEKDVVKALKEREIEARVCKFSSGSGVRNPSRRSSDSGAGSSQDNDAIPQHKPPIPRQLVRATQHHTLPRTRQRCSSNSSTGSERGMNSKKNHPVSSKKRMEGEDDDEGDEYDDEDEEDYTDLDDLSDKDNDDDDTDDDDQPNIQKKSAMLKQNNVQKNKKTQVKGAEDEKDDDDQANIQKKSAMLKQNNVQKNKKTRVKGADKAENADSPKETIPKQEIEQKSAPKKNPSQPVTEELERRRLRDSKMLFIKDLPIDITAEELKALSTDIVDVQLPMLNRKHQGKTLFGFLSFKTEAKAQSNFKSLQSKKLRGQPMTLDFVGVKSKNKKQTEDTEAVFNMTKLFVSGIPVNATIDKVAKHFPLAFQITFNQSPVFRTAMINFINEDDARTAYKSKREIKLFGQKLVVLYSKKGASGVATKKRKHNRNTTTVLSGST